jgi:perosamine synthetase
LGDAGLIEEVPMEPIAFSRPYTFTEEATAAAEVIAGQWLVGGSRLQEFERRAAALCGAREAVGVSSWTTGAFLVLHAWGIGPGDEVIVPSYTFIASVNVIRHAGATPVFADIDPRTWNIDPEDMARRITPRTRAIVAVDQVGLPCDMDAITALAASRGIKVLDDAACAFASLNRGRPVGSMADVAVFSLHARKIVTTGEGGIIVTDDADFAARLRRLRHQGMSLSDFQRHGMSPTTFEEYPEVGFNFRITDIQAAVGLGQLDRLPDILARRRAVAERYDAELADLPLQLPHVPEGMVPNWQSYQAAVLADGPVGRNALMEALHERGIPTRRGVMASHLEAPYRDDRASLPVTEDVHRRAFQLPIHPALTGSQQGAVIAALRDLLGGERQTVL